MNAALRLYGVYYENQRHWYGILVTIQIGSIG